ncbi:MAG: LON peptidase substrate-binding domain-containing protein [Verrucomicrobiales bacterium]
MVPSTIPVIVLAECNIFPHALLPLNIFEPRYRAMLDHALKADRFLAVATLRAVGEHDWDESDANIHPYSCAGMIRACVGQPDGTFRLILQGTSRIRFTEWIQREPFRIAACETVPTETRDADTARHLADQALDRARGSLRAGSPFAEQFDKQFGALRDPEIVADVIGYNFLPRASVRQPLLGMGSVEHRLEYILAHLAPVSPATE